MDYENTKSFTKPEQVTLPPQRRPNTQAMTPHIKMFVSDWFTDELGRIRVYGSSRASSGQSFVTGRLPAPLIGVPSLSRAPGL